MRRIIQVSVLLFVISVSAKHALSKKLLQLYNSVIN